MTTTRTKRSHGKKSFLNHRSLRTIALVLALVAVGALFTETSHRFDDSHSEGADIGRLVRAHAQRVTARRRRTEFTLNPERVDAACAKICPARGPQSSGRRTVQVAGFRQNPYATRYCY